MTTQVTSEVALQIRALQSIDKIAGPGAGGGWGEGQVMGVRGAHVWEILAGGDI